MKKVFVVLASAMLTVSAWGQSVVRRIDGSDSSRDLSECAAAIAHRDSILVFQGRTDHNMSGIDFEWYVTTVIVLRSRGDFSRGYYELRHQFDKLILSPNVSNCIHYRIDSP